MAVTLVSAQRPDPVSLSALQLRLVTHALYTAGCPNYDLLTPGSYIPSHITSSWASRVLAVFDRLQLVWVWDPLRAQLRPRSVVRRADPTPPERSGRPRRTSGNDAEHRAGDHPLNPAVELPAPPVLPAGVEVEALAGSALGPLLWSLTEWWGTSGGATVVAGRARR